METVITHLRRVTRLHKYDRHAGEFGFVLNELSEHREIPSSDTGAEYFSLAGGRFSNALQILKRNAKILFLGLRNDSLGNRVVHDKSRSSFFSRKPFQNPFRVLCAFGLERRTNLLAFDTIIFNRFAGHYFAGRKCSDIFNPEIYTEKIFHVFDFLFGKFNTLEKKKLSFSGNEIGFAFDERYPIRTKTNEGHFQSTVDRPDGNLFFRIRQNPGIISNRSERLESALRLFIKFVGIRNFGETTRDNLSGQVRRLFYFVIAKAMELKLIENFLLPCNCRNFITDRISPADSFKKKFRLSIIG